MFARPRLAFRRLTALLLGGAAIAVLALTAWHPGQGAAGAISFTPGTLNAVIERPTSLAFGPDGRLYVASETRIKALTLNAQGTEVTGTEVVATGLSEFQSASAQVHDMEVIEAAKRGLDRSIAIVHAEMKRGLSGLATIGSTAPFVGLFGTVVGIINAFKGIESTKATGLSAASMSRGFSTFAMST